VPIIPGVERLEEIGRGTDSVVFRARRGDLPVVVKLARAPEFDPEARRRFRREAALLGSLHHPGLPAVYATGEVDGRPYLVRAFIDGQNLAALITLIRLPESRVLRLAIDVTGALGALHRRGLVHRDVSPANIVLGADGHARLIDFGLAATPAAEQPVAPAGTFHYAAPEQTGLLKRPVDARADLYALGAVLFEALVGHPPFQARHAAEVVRQHAALPAPDVRSLRPDISPCMGLVVARLLEKDPDDRYPSAESLLADLHELPGLNEALHAGRPVVLARSTADLGDPPPLTGRAPLMSALMEAWRETRLGRGRSLLLTGDAGSGKSRVLRAFFAAPCPEPGPVGVRLFARASGTGAGGLLPLRRAVEHAVSELPPTGGPALAHLRAGVGDQAPLLATFSTALADRLGVTAPVFAAPDIGERLFDALAAFFVGWARSAGALLLCIDDAHLCDEPTRQVVSRLLQATSRAPLLLVLTQPDASSAWAGMGATTLTVPPLGPDDVTAYLESLLKPSRLDPTLVARLMTHSHGNAFALEQFVRALLEGGLLVPDWGEWTLDTAALEQLPLPRDVLELVLGRLMRLGPEARAVLEAAAVQGRRFRPGLVARVLGQDADRVVEALAHAIDSWLIERDPDGAFAFVHERVQDVLLGGLTDAARRDLHQRTADALLEPGEPTEALDLYAVARHAALGHRSRDPQRVFGLQLRAGLRALREFAPEEAWHLLVDALHSAESAGLPAPVELHHALGDAAARTGRLDAAETHLDAALEAARSPEEAAAIHVRLAEAALTRSDVTGATEAVLAGLARVGAPERPVGLPWVVFALLRDAVARRRPPAAAAASLLRSEVLAGLLYFRTYTAFFEMRPIALAATILRQRWVTRALPPQHPAAVLAAAHLAILQALRHRTAAALALARDAVALAERAGDPQLLARAHLLEAFTVHFCGHSVEAAERSAVCLRQHGHWLDAFEFLNGCGDLAWNLYLRGYPSEAATWVERGLGYEANASPRSSRTFGNVFEALGGPVLAMLGRELDAEVALERARERVFHRSLNRLGVPGRAPDVFRQAAFAGCEAAYCLERSDFGPAFDALLARFEALRLRPEETTPHVRLFYVAAAWGRLEQWRMKPGDPVARRAFEASRDALHHAATLPILRMHVHLLAGAARIVDGLCPLTALGQAAELARQTDSPWGAFEVARLTARRLLATGPDAALHREARIAHQLATEHGWVERARRLQAEFGFIGGASSPFESLTAPSLLLRRQRDALLSVAQAGATVIDPEAQSRRVLDETVRLLGAERAFLLGPHQGAAEDDTPLPTMGHLALAVRAGRDAHGRELAAPDDLHTAIIDRVVLTHLALVHGHVEPQGTAAPEADEPQSPRSALAAPLLHRDRLLGVVYVDHRRARGIFTPDDAQILLAIAQHLTIALETARHTQLEVYRRIAANVPGMVFRLHRRTDGRLRFDYVSEAARDLLGVAPEALLADATRLTTAFEDADAARLTETLRVSGESGAPWKFEGRLPGPTPRWIEGIGRPERSPTGDVSWDGLLTDVTDRKRNEDSVRALNVALEERVRSRTQELAAANKELEAFNYSVSHDLRSALRSVEGFSAMLREDHARNLGPVGAELLDRVTEAAKRMWKVLDALHDLSRLNRAEMRRESVDLAQLARACFEDLRRQEPGRAVALELEPPLEAQADAPLVRVVLENLLTNAWKFTVRRPVARIAVGQRPTDDGPAFFVRDDGIGFDPKHASKLFSPFQRLHGREEFPGTGIGLFTVQRIIARHGGRIWAEAAPGLGATFWFTLSPRPATTDAGDDTSGSGGRSTAVK
jgi:signal transduction histidine kinase/tRNA A-37 threonylcarbamoyl transferase component Bud32/tetratricopeptide (TPR) repeat protein